MYTETTSSLDHLEKFRPAQYGGNDDSSVIAPGRCIIKMQFEDRKRDCDAMMAAIDQDLEMLDAGKPTLLDGSADMRQKSFLLQVSYNQVGKQR